MVPRMACLANTRTESVGFPENSGQGALYNQSMRIIMLIAIVGTSTRKVAVFDSGRSPNPTCHNHLYDGHVAFNKASDHFRRTASSRCTWQSRSSDVKGGSGQGEGGDCKSDIGRGDQEVGEVVEGGVHALDGGGRCIIGVPKMYCFPLYMYFARSFRIEST